MGLKPHARRSAVILISSVLAASLPAAEEKKDTLVLPAVIDWTTPQNKAPLPDGLRYGLMDSVKDKPAKLLIAMARQARDEGRFADAVFILQSAVDSSWGRQEFDRNLKAALAAANRRMNREARPVLYEKGFKLPKEEKTDILHLSLFEPQKNEATQTTRARIEVQSLLEEGFKEKWRWLILQRSVTVFQEELKKLMPLNGIEITASHQKYYISGHFNAEYPSVVPETNLELGLLYKDTQDFVLARHHLEASLEQRAFLPVPEREFQARFALAEIAVIQGRMYDYEKILKEICSRDRDYTSQEGALANRRNQMKDVLLSDPAGFDRLVQLYRLPDDFSLEAHRQLGVMYLQRKDYEQALMHLIFATLKPASHAIDELRGLRYGYTYSSLGAFLATVRQYPEIMEYLGQSGFFASLYCLSQTVVGYKPAYLRLPRQLWTALAQAPEAGVIQPQAKEMLRRTGK
jgi:thioredoxin-like negative regulator of GroEL